ncbi:Transmembrane protein 97 [Coemansia interrupta]|uniref:Efficient mitochondria targeting-associated protein 19 n=1 Tax=Coemansia interrupta TaxID=1126814 RepID=A0A9W8HBW4_9FUNG|nr:Transmembrane protein 97 [Coemansia interrupta]
MAPDSRVSRGLSLLDRLYFGYFVSHIPITLLVDVVPLFPSERIPAFMLGLNRFLTEQLSDPFMVIGTTRSDMTWFKSLLACELVFQLPFFFYAAYAIWNRSPARHAPLLVYGAHVSTTMVPILGVLAFGDIERTLNQRLMLGGLYLPYLLIPLSMAFVSFGQCARAISGRQTKEKTS